MAVAGVATAGLGVAVVEAAGAVVVGSVEDRVHALRRVAPGRAAGGIVAVAGAGRDEDAVGLLAVQCDGCAGRTGQVVVAVGFRATEATGRSLSEVVTAAGLVVNDRDEAGRARAEGVLGGGIGNTASRPRRDGGRGTVAAASHLVEWAVEGIVQGTSGAMRGDAGGTAGSVDVAGPSGDKGDRNKEAQSECARAFEARSGEHV